VTFLAKFFAFASILYLIKTLIYPFFKPVSKKQKKRMRMYVKERKNVKFKEKVKDFKKEFAHKYVKKLIGISERQRFQKIIDRLDLGIKPEEIRLEQLIYAFGAIILTILMASANKILGFITAIFIVLGWLYPVEELEKIIEKKDKNISLEFPSFYSMVYYQYSKSVNIYLADVIKDYILNAGPDMAEELGVMLDNMDYGEEFALKQLKRRVPVHQIIKFCDIMETRLKGYDNTSQMAYLKNELDEYRIRALEDELQKRQNSNSRIQFVLIVILMVYIALYYLFMLLTSLKMFQ
jgi:Flp pilus assembly protein TadB